MGESKLPSGPPADKGLSLDKDIPGSATHSKPEGDVRDFDKSEDSSMYKVDGPDDLLKNQTKPDSIDHQDAKPQYNGLGTSGKPGDYPHENEYGGYSKTKYPYRDGIPNAHNASDRELAEEIAGIWRLRSAHSLLLPAEVPIKIAAKLSEMLSGLNPKFVERAAKCAAKLKRVDGKNLRWIISVNCGNGAKVVHIKATRPSKNVVKLSKMDLLVACSCPAWQWLGPEHHAVQKGYLERGPRGTASVPFVKDPQNHNLVCKHVAAALAVARAWEVPKKG